MSGDNDQKRKDTPYFEKSRNNDQKRKYSLYMERSCHMTMVKNNAYMCNELQLQTQSSTFIHKNKSSLSATSLVHRSPMAYNTTVSLNTLTCTNYVNFWNCQNRFGRFSWSENHSNYLDEVLKVFEKNDNKVFRLI